MERHAVVTGAAQGIGLAVVQRLVREGWTVTGLDLVAPTAPVEGARYVQVDVTDPDQLEAAASGLGPVHGLVNNAAVYGLRAFEDIGLAEWEHTFAVNVNAPFRLTQLLLDRLAEAQGAVVNVSSALAFKGAPQLVHYIATKAALIGMSRALARELGPRNVRVNTVAPGLTDTQNVRDLFGDAHFERQRGMRALPVHQQAADVAGPICYLLSPDAALVTGQVLVVDGGSHFH